MKLAHRTGGLRKRAGLKAKIAMGALTAIAAGAAPLTAPNTAYAATVAASFAKTAQWNSGYTAYYEIHNDSPRIQTGWRLEFVLPDGVEIHSMWNAHYEVSARKVIVTPESWTRDIEPGRTIVIGFSVGHLAIPDTDPRDCRIDGNPCVESAKQPETLPSAPVDPDPQQPTPISGAGAGQVTPYVDASAYPPHDLAEAADQAGTRSVGLSSVVTGQDPCEPTWGGAIEPDQDAVAGQIDSFRRQGGQVRVSFGGPSGEELARTCRSVKALSTAYRKVIDAYQLTDIDFVVTGEALADQAANTRRAQAVALLQRKAAARGATLKVSFTLSAMPYGLTPDGVALLHNAVAHGVRGAKVNLLAKDYGPGYSGSLAGHTLSAARAAHATMKAVFATSDAGAWARLGITAVGATTTDMQRLAAVARTKGMRLAEWPERDWRACEEPCSRTDD
ncbi:cellulose binding domain-containing protein [Streptomyces noursei]